MVVLINRARMCVANFRMVHFVFGSVNLEDLEFGEFGIEIEFYCSRTDNQTWVLRQ